MSSVNGSVYRAIRNGPGCQVSEQYPYNADGSGDRKSEFRSGRILRRWPAAGWLWVQELHREELPSVG